MSRIRTLLFVALAIAAGAAAAIAQRDLSKVEIKVAKIADGIYELEGAGGNMAVCVGPDGALLIDDEFAELSDRIKAAVATVTDQPIKYIFNTHWHGDHSGGNENFANAGVTIVAHDNVPGRMSVDFKNPVFGWESKASPRKALPVVTFNDHVSFHLNGQDVECIHVKNAHTDGDAIVWFKQANVIHAGDCLFNHMYPIIDAGSGGSIQGMIEAEETILKMMGPDTKVINGHGPPASKADVQASHDMLVQVRDRVTKLVKQGKTVDQIIAAHPLADLDGTWGASFVKADVMVKGAAAGVKR